MGKIRVIIGAIVVRVMDNGVMNVADVIGGIEMIGVDIIVSRCSLLWS